MYCWSLAWRILSITLLTCEMSASRVLNHYKWKSWVGNFILKCKRGKAMIMTVLHTLSPFISRVLPVTKDYRVTPFKAILRPLQRTHIFFTLDQWFFHMARFTHPTPRGHLALSEGVFCFKLGCRGMSMLLLADTAEPPTMYGPASSARNYLSPSVNGLKLRELCSAPKGLMAFSQGHISTILI